MGIGVQAPKRPSSATVLGVGQSEAVQVLLADNPDRKGALIHNASATWLYVRLGAGASVSDYSVRLLPGNTLALDNPAYTGQVTGIWPSPGPGEARISEMI